MCHDHRPPPQWVRILFWSGSRGHHDGANFDVVSFCCVFVLWYSHHHSWSFEEGKFTHQAGESTREMIFSGVREAYFWGSSCLLFISGFCSVSWFLFLLTPCILDVTNCSAWWRKTQCDHFKQEVDACKQESVILTPTDMDIHSTQRSLVSYLKWITRIMTSRFCVPLKIDRRGRDFFGTDAFCPHKTWERVFSVCLELTYLDVDVQKFPLRRVFVSVQELGTRSHWLLFVEIRWLNYV